MTESEVPFLPDLDEADEDPVPVSVLLTDDALRALMTAMRGRQAEASQPIKADGAFGSADGYRSISVRSASIEVPESAEVVLQVHEKRPGLKIQAGDPVPHGTHIWIAADAAAHANHTMRLLSRA